MSTVVDQIRAFLTHKGIDYPTEKAVNELAAEGKHVTKQNVYSVRSNMKREDAAKAYQELASKSLRTHVIEVIGSEKQTVAEIANTVKKNGYVSRSNDLPHRVRMECYKLEKEGKITSYRSGGTVRYNNEQKVLETEPETATVPVLEELPPIAPVETVELPLPEPLPELETSLGISSANINDLIRVQKLMRELGGPAKLQQHVKVLEELATKPAIEVLELFAKIS